MGAHFDRLSVTWPAEDTVIPYTPANCLLAEAYCEAGRWPDGIAEFGKLKVDFTDNRLHYSSWAVRAHYSLGKAYEQTGQTDLAIEQYQMFLDLWKEADAEIAEVEDARARLARLRSAPTPMPPMATPEILSPPTPRP
jgi:tetratricopeptide (TPR) repeat protein